MTNTKIEPQIPSKLVKDKENKTAKPINNDNNNNINTENNNDPLNELKQLAEQWNIDFYSEEFAIALDNSNIWPTYRDRFYYPKMKDLPKVDLSLLKNQDDESIYFCGNSLGLQPRTLRQYVDRQFDKWAKIGVYGHFEGELPWADCEMPLKPAMAKIVGAKSESEINILNFLTVNLHLLMVSFYQPTKTRFKILIEDKAFPSDHYAVESQIKLNNLDPKDCLVLIKPREGEQNFRTEDILKVIQEQGDSIALVLLSGVQYFTGQYFEIEKITKEAQSKGCKVGWDCAHAAGNVQLKLHDWNVDFACWCGYKYMNAGAGSISGIFIHEKNFDLIGKSKKLDGWWSHRAETRFMMTNKMEYEYGASSYSISNPSILLCSALKSSLDLFDEIGMDTLTKKSKVLTGYLEDLLHRLQRNKISNVESLTPTDPAQRGCQLSFRFPKGDILKVHNELEKRGVVCDFRSPDCLRFAPVPLYNTFHEIYRFMSILENLLKTHN